MQALQSRVDGQHEEERGQRAALLDASLGAEGCREPIWPNDSDTVAMVAVEDKVDEVGVDAQFMAICVQEMESNALATSRKRAWATSSSESQVVSMMNWRAETGVHPVGEDGEEEPPD